MRIRIKRVVSQGDLRIENEVELKLRGAIANANAKAHIAEAVVAMESAIGIQIKQEEP